MPTRDLINLLNQADLQAVISLLKSNFANPDAVTDLELSRATVEGLMTRQSRGVMLLPNRDNTSPETAVPFYSEVLEQHIGYLRFGTLNNANLQTLDKTLRDFGSKKVDAMIVDLRADAPANDFGIAAEFAKRFCAKGKTLFKLRKPGTRQDRAFASDRDPAFQGLITVLVDGDTAGTAESLAAALRNCTKALVIGQPSGGRAVEYSDLPLPSGKILRVAVAEAVAADDQKLFPDGIKPDLPVEMPMIDKRQIFIASAQKGIAPFIYETGRPHMNEAALIAGTNPEVDAAEAAQRRRERGQEKSVHDLVLQRALDLVTSLEIYQKR